MGAYLRIGFVAKATATIPVHYSKTTLNLQLGRFYPKNTFNCKVSNGEITWTLKPKIIQTELVAFANEFYRDYLGREGNAEWVQSIANAPNGLKHALETQAYRFRVDEDNCSESFPLDSNQQIRLRNTIIFLGSEGKFLMENGDCTLRFLENCAQKAYSHFKLGNTIRVHLF